MKYLALLLLTSCTGLPWNHTWDPITVEDLHSSTVYILKLPADLDPQAVADLLELLRALEQSGQLRIIKSPDEGR